MGESREQPTFVRYVIDGLCQGLMHMCKQFLFLLFFNHRAVAWPILVSEADYIMAHSSTPYSSTPYVGMTPKRMVATSKVHK